MAIPLRHADPVNIAATARTFFVTSSIARKRSLLQSDRAAKLFLEILYHYRSEHTFLLHDFVVMPDHFHVLITIGQDISIERAVQFIKGGFAFRAGKELGFTPPVWERGFSEVRVLDPDTCVGFHEYIGRNPVEDHLVEKPSDYPYCSFHPEFHLDEIPQGLKPHLQFVPDRHA